MGTWADWLGVLRHTFSPVFGAVIARGLDYSETFRCSGLASFDFDRGADLQMTTASISGAVVLGRSSNRQEYHESQQNCHK
jgi:hypothetical protein